MLIQILCESTGVSHTLVLGEVGVLDVDEGMVQWFQSVLSGCSQRLHVNNYISSEIHILTAIL